MNHAVRNEPLFLIWRDALSFWSSKCKKANQRVATGSRFLIQFLNIGNIIFLIFMLYKLCSKKLHKIQRMTTLKTFLKKKVWRYLSQWLILVMMIKQYVTAKLPHVVKRYIGEILVLGKKNCHQHPYSICRWWISSPTSVQFQDLDVDESINIPNFSPLYCFDQFAF